MPGRYWTPLHVSEGHRHRGVDVNMLHYAIREAPEPVCELRTCIREDFVPAAGFLEPERFEERFRSWGAHLALGTFDSIRFAPLVHELAQSGIRLVGYHDRAVDPERDRRLVALQHTGEEDALALEPAADQSDDVVTLATGGTNYVMRRVSATPPSAIQLGDASAPKPSQGSTGPALAFGTHGSLTQEGAEPSVDAPIPWPHRRLPDHTETRSRNPSARTTLRTVANCGFPSSDSAI